MITNIQIYGKILLGGGVMKKYFYCYSMNLKKFLMDNGLRYEWVDTNPKSNKLYYKFERTEELNNLLTQWSKGK